MNNFLTVDIHEKNMMETDFSFSYSLQKELCEYSKLRFPSTKYIREVLGAFLQTSSSVLY